MHFLHKLKNLNFNLKIWKKVKKKKNKILQEIISEEQKRKSKIDKIRNSLTDEDFDYIDKLF